MERGEGSNKIPILGDSQMVDANPSKPLSPRIVSGEQQLAGEEPNTTEAQNDVSTDVACPSNALTKRGRGRPKGSQSSAKKLKRCIEMIQSIPSFQDVTNGTDDEKDGDSEPVRSVMMRFDAVRRRLRQYGMLHGEVSLALGTFKKLNLYANKEKRVGSVPGVEVGDIFFFWGEMRLVGLHTTPIALDVEDEQEYTCTQTAISVVSSGSNADTTEDPENLIFKGLGTYHDKPSYRHVKRLNRPLEIALDRKNLVRVIRSWDDEKKVNGNIYIYDGLYLVTCMWAEKGDDGTFNVLKFKLERQPDQKPGYATWKSVDEWRYGFSTRPGLVLPDLSDGAEDLKVPLVNEFKDGNVPTPFTYVTSLTQVVIDLPPLVDLCTCKNRSCGSTNGDCACVQRNGGGLPYLDEMLLVTRGPMVFECGGSCPCSGKCKNKMIQTGLKFKLEVFKTVGCGWGLRSWEPIRAGSFICEYAGDIISKGDEEEDDDYIFDTSRVYKSFKWNYEPELVGEDASEKVPEQLFVPSSLMISAKKSGNVARFMNHSCSPNVFWQYIAREENGLWCTHIAFFAMRHIPPLTELTYDYGVSRGDKKKICRCRSKKCVGSFG